MARRRTSLHAEKDAGQLFLFAERAPVGDPPDLDEVFADLNRRFFAGGLTARIEWSNRLTSSAGSCRPDEGLIRVSRLYWRRHPESLAVTIAHEMIHLVTPNHGAEFRRIGRPIADALGVDWNEFRYATRWADLSRYRYLYACPNCGLELPSKKRRRASCGKCNPGGYDERYRLTLTESRANPGPVLRGERPVRAS